MNKRGVWFLVIGVIAIVVLSYFAYEALFQNRNPEKFYIEQIVMGMAVNTTGLSYTFVISPKNNSRYISWKYLLNGVSFDNYWYQAGLGNIYKLLNHYKLEGTLIGVRIPLPIKNISVYDYEN